MDPDGMKKVCTTNCLTRNATRMATPNRIGSSFQNEPLLLLVCSSITHGAYVAKLRTTITGRVSFRAPGDQSDPQYGRRGADAVEDILLSQRPPPGERRRDHHGLADDIFDGYRALAP